MLYIPNKDNNTVGLESGIKMLKWGISNEISSIKNIHK